MKTIKAKFPPIGMRIVKSAAAILFCYLISFIRGNSGIVFYSQLAALWCIQANIANTKKNALQRFLGTCIGALYGLLYLLVRREWVKNIGFNELIDAAAVSVFIIITLYTTVLLQKKQASYFSCVVLLSIVVNHVTDNNPYLFVWNRFLDTVIGIGVGIAVNGLSLPHDKRQDILFISGLDDTLLFDKKEKMSDYSKIELNRMLEDGILFTISTMRTPASLIEPLRDIKLKLPVIAMNGAVLYDICDNRYLKVYTISGKTAKQVQELIYQEGFTLFSNVIIDDMLVIYYEENADEVNRQLVEKLRRSPYRNYVQRKLPEEEKVVYFMLLYPRETIEYLYDKLEKAGFTKELRILKYDSEDYTGYAYLKIYNKNATRQNMMDYLKKFTHTEQVVTFGSIPGQSDVVIEEGDINKVVHMLKKLYEPVRFRSGKSG